MKLFSLLVLVAVTGNAGNLDESLAEVLFDAEVDFAELSCDDLLTNQTTLTKLGQVVCKSTTSSLLSWANSVKVFLSFLGIFTGFILIVEFKNTQPSKETKEVV